MTRRARPPDDLGRIIALAQDMPVRRTLEELMQLIADRGAQLLGVERVGVRLLDPSRQRLIAVARAGQAVHSQPVEFKIGEGLVGWIVQHDQSIRVDEAEHDPRFAPRPGMIAKIGSFVGVPIRAGTQCIGVLSATAVDDTFDERDQQLLELVAAMSGPYLEISRLSRLSRVDPLTGALNRRGLDESFPEIVGRSDGVVDPLSVAMLDIDHFKRVNDEHGHASGDVVLRHVSTTVANLLRRGDAVIRYGGEEFLLVLPEAALAHAMAIAERIRVAVAASAAPIGPAGVAVTVSMGVAERRANESRDAVIQRADDALYQAKQTGRNRVVAAT